MTGKWALTENLRESQGITGDSRGTARDKPGNTLGNVRESIEKRASGAIGVRLRDGGPMTKA
jgi:hypothetical protein